MTALISSIVAVAPARVYLGLWAGDCLNCGANDVQPFDPMFTCAGCGGRYELAWPAPPMVRAVMRLLLMRPYPANRNWFSDESLHDLMRENAEKGIFDGIQGEHGQSQLTVGDEEIITDALPRRLLLPARPVRAVQA